MTQALRVEFAESEVARALLAGGRLHLQLAAAAALQIEPASAPRHGHVMEVEWVLYEAVVTGSLTDLVGRIAAGRAFVGGVWRSQWPLPCRVDAPVRLEIDMANRSALVATGSALECRLAGGAVFRESLAC